MRYNLEDAYALKSLIEALFGSDAWLEIKHCQDLGVWKKYSKRILAAIHASIVTTVKVADDDWFTEVEFEVAHGQRSVDSAKSLEILFSCLSAALANISFLQIGYIPHRLEERNVAARPGNNWKLDHSRSVQYVQNQEQKRWQLSSKKLKEEDG